MSEILLKKHSMILYSGATDPYSHRVRIVLAEKDLTPEILDTEALPNAKEEVNQLNPYGTPPLLLDRELVLYQSEFIMEYLDERFPHPPLMPIGPMAKARARLIIYRFTKDWYTLMDAIQRLQSQEPHSEKLAIVRAELRDRVTSLAPAFVGNTYFLGEEFSLVDCSLAPLLWRLPALGIELPSQALSVLTYQERLFKRASFDKSLTRAEKAMPH